MNTDPKIGSDFDPDNIIAVALEDLSEDDRREFERELEEEKVEKITLKLAGYQKTRNNIVKKIAATSPSHPFGVEVKKSTEEITHLIDVSIASKYGSGMTNTTHTITKAVVDKFEEFKEQLSKDLGINLHHHALSLRLQSVHEYYDKKLMPMENNRVLNLPSNILMRGASANVIQPHVALNNNQGGPNYASGSANNFISSAPTPIVSTLWLHKITTTITEVIF